MDRTKCIASKDGKCMNVFAHGMGCGGYSKECKLKPHYDSLNKTAKTIQKLTMQSLGIKSDRQ